MANILQVTNPGMNDNRANINTQDPRTSQNNTRIQNPIDPTRVVRPDGREGGRTSGAGEGAYSVIDYESNYGAFIKSLEEGTGGLPAALERLFFSDMAAFREAGQAEEAARNFLASLQISSPEELMAYLKGQAGGQLKFSGTLFDSLRSLFSQNISESLREALGDFLKVYNDYSSGTHLLRQMQNLAGDIEKLMLSQFREEFRQLADAMNWEAMNGDTQYNTGILNGKLIPFLSDYISKTHDFGSIRDASMLLIFNAVRYENGGMEQLTRLFERMMANREFARLYPGDAGADMSALLAASRGHTNLPADALAEMLLRGANGQAGLENIQQFYTMLNGLLLNESVYMPLMHILFPFQYQEQKVMSEAWVDPDSERGVETGSRKIKMLLKFDIQSLGKFEMVLALQNRQVDMQLYVPRALQKKESDIREKVGGIMKDNGMDLKRIQVQERLRESRIEEVFPEIREKERTINVRI